MKIILDFVRQINWIDILVFAVFSRVIFIAFRQGFSVEFFKTLGTVCAVYLSLHYGAFLAGLLSRHPGTVSAFSNLVCFSFLAILGYGIFWLIRLLLFKFVTAQISFIIERWGGLACAFFRALMLSSLILYGLFLTEFTYVKRSIRCSLSGKYVVTVSGAIYASFWNGLMSKFMTRERFNQAVKDVETFEVKKNK